VQQLERAIELEGAPRPAGVRSVDDQIERGGDRDDPPIRQARIGRASQAKRGALDAEEERDSDAV
jgi:hypothetical protein